MTIVVDEADELLFRHKRKTMSEEELTQRMLNSAVEIIQEHGLTVSLDHIEMEALIRLADVPRSSVYKKWKSKDRFLVDLMVALVKPTDGQGAAFDPSTLEASSRVIQENADRLATPEGRDAVMREAIRLGARRNFDALLESPSWQTYVALNVALPVLDDEDARQVQGALQAAERHFITSMATFYDKSLPVLGRRTKPGVTTSMIAAAGAAVVEGLANRLVSNGQLISTPIMMPGMDGELVEWHLAAVGFLAIMEALTETIT